MCRSCITISRANCSQTWQGDMAPERPIAASDDCLKRDKKRRLLKAQGTGGHSSIVQRRQVHPIRPFLLSLHCCFSDSKSSPFFRGHRFFFGRFESTSLAKSFLLRHTIDVDNIIEYTITRAFA